MITEHPHLETERIGPVLVIRLANEAARNSLTREMRYSLRRVVEETGDDPTVRSVLLTAKGPTFCSGGDLRMLTKAADPWPVHRRFRHAATLFPALTGLDRPVVCAVRGTAIGGGMGLALMSDLVVAGESAEFHAGFFRIGAVPDCLTLFTLPRLVGLAKTRALLYGNTPWRAADLLDLGLAFKVVPDDEVEAEGLALAQRLAEGPAAVMGLSKRLLLRSFETSLSEMMELEGFGQVLAMSGAEFREGLAALRDRRAPDFLAAALAHPTGDGMAAPPAPEPAASPRS